MTPPGPPVRCHPAQLHSTSAHDEYDEHDDHSSHGPHYGGVVQLLVEVNVLFRDLGCISCHVWVFVVFFSAVEQVDNSQSCLVDVGLSTLHLLLML